MRENVQTIADWRADTATLRSSYRRLAESRLPVNIYSAQAQLQRRAAALLHGKGPEQSSWEELDGRQLADDERGDRTSLLLGGATGGVALTPANRSAGLLARAGTGTLFLTHVEKLSPAARRILSSIAANRRYTPVGDPYPRPVNCRIILATTKPVQALARSFQLEWELADTLGHIAIRAESIIAALESEDLISHPSSLAAAS